MKKSLLALLLLSVCAVGWRLSFVSTRPEGRPSVVAAPSITTGTTPLGHADMQSGETGNNGVTDLLCSWVDQPDRGHQVTFSLSEDPPGILYRESDVKTRTRRDGRVVAVRGSSVVVELDGTRPLTQERLVYEYRGDTLWRRDDGLILARNR